jgi:hypothetical protein
LQEADLGVGPLTITSTRSKVIDFTIPYIQDSVGFIMKRPEPQNKTFHIFRPFSLEVWLALSVTVLVVGLTSGIVNSSTPSSGFRRLLKDCTRDEVSIKNNVWFVLGLFMQHGKYMTGHREDKMILSQIIRDRMKWSRDGILTNTISRFWSMSRFSMETGGRITLGKSSSTLFINLTL